MERRDADVLVDSLLWIEFLSGKENEETAEVERLIRARSVVLAGPIVFEVLVGPRREAQRQYLQGRLRAFRMLATEERVWLRAIELGRLDGVAARKVPFSDILIAAHADHHGCKLFTTNAHFDAFPDLRRHRI